MPENAQQVMINGWLVTVVADKTGQMGIFVANQDGSPVIGTEAAPAHGGAEWGALFTTAAQMAVVEQALKDLRGEQ